MKTRHKCGLGKRTTFFTVIGVALRSIAYLSIILSSVATIAIPLLYKGGSRWAPVYVSMLILTWSLLFWGIRLSAIGRRYLSRVLDAPDELYDQSFVLYLRSFGNDSVLAKPEMTFIDAVTPLNGHILFSSGLTAEEQIVQALASAGPVVAAGRPGEKLPHVGALRIYLTEESWQEVVLDLMRRARLVVLSVGLGRGLLWELHQAVHSLPPNRLVILVSQSREEYEEFQKSLEAYFDSMTSNRNPMARVSGSNVINLPDFPTAEEWENLGVFHSWLISFNSDWVAERTTLAGSGLQRNRIRKALREAVNPLLQRLS
jgi:hypothetical protein